MMPLWPHSYNLSPHSLNGLDKSFQIIRLNTKMFPLPLITLLHIIPTKATRIHTIRVPILTLRVHRVPAVSQAQTFSPPMWTARITRTLVRYILPFASMDYELTDATGIDVLLAAASIPFIWNILCIYTSFIQALSGQEGDELGRRGGRISDCYQSQEKN
jgi:hypothetical protein